MNAVICRMKVFDRERADQMYSVSAYLSAWFSINIPVYSALATLFSVIVYFMIGLRMDNLAFHFGLYCLTNIVLSIAKYGFFEYFFFVLC
jgi:ABC-type multidrug transport system permease subunit